MPVTTFYAEHAETTNRVAGISPSVTVPEGALGLVLEGVGWR
ncbi:hypothetical protein Ssi03_73140 [Sphaerisporangium siamense]|uniref:Uncharacterized protein n=1 Tax=Sphaerisporangium siamense TaxID=795645 RepID=A0A7W7GDL5_9ACTN|nr:hypothetical protein [Sphaerisporangium siamense]MBB4703136.1 hypothetical protein [Sphaerisporangium siamense]GII89324.1 hypothetical protein Ssi03_73140 [Sphaerisporangium siamense]